MEDRFKFRFWHKPTKRMLSVYSYNSDFVFADTLDGIGTEYNPARFEDCFLMQCTGPKDRNGKLIFEGDIVKQTNNEPYNGTFPVVWVESSLTYVLKINNELNYHHSADWYEQAEVIGNIYENPELLESEILEEFCTDKIISTIKTKIREAKWKWRKNE